MSVLAQHRFYILVFGLFVEVYRRLTWVSGVTVMWKISAVILATQHGHHFFSLKATRHLIIHLVLQIGRETQVCAGLTDLRVTWVFTVILLGEAGCLWVRNLSLIFLLRFGAILQLFCAITHVIVSIAILWVTCVSFRLHLILYRLEHCCVQVFLSWLDYCAALANYLTFVYDRSILNFKLNLNSKCRACLLFTYNFTVFVKKSEQVLLNKLSRVTCEGHEVFPCGFFDTVTFPLHLEHDLFLF